MATKKPPSSSIFSRARVKARPGKAPASFGQGLSALKKRRAPRFANDDKSWAKGLPSPKIDDSGALTHKNILAELRRLIDQDLTEEAYAGIAALIPSQTYFIRFFVNDYDSSESSSQGSAPGYGGAESRTISFAGLGESCASFALSLTNNCFIKAVHAQKIRPTATIGGRPVYRGDHLTDLTGRRLTGSGKRMPHPRKRGRKKIRSGRMSHAEKKRLMDAERNARSRARKTQAKLDRLMAEGKTKEAFALQRKVESLKRTAAKKPKKPKPFSRATPKPKK